MTSKMKLAGIGIDLINPRRIRQLVRRASSKQLHRLLSPSERKRFSKKKISPQALTKIFTAKEAFFKTLNQSWMGPEGFQTMSVRFKNRKAFEIFLDNTAAPIHAEGCFFNAGHLCGAQVIRWK